MCLIKKEKKLSWHYSTKVKSSWKEDGKIKHLSLVENISRPRIKGTLLVIGALY